MYHGWWDENYDVDLASAQKSSQPAGESSETTTVKKPATDNSNQLESSQPSQDEHSTGGSLSSESSSQTETTPPPQKVRAISVLVRMYNLADFLMITDLKETLSKTCADYFRSEHDYLVANSRALYDIFQEALQNTHSGDVLLRPVIIHGCITSISGSDTEANQKMETLLREEVPTAFALAKMFQADQADLTSQHEERVADLETRRDNLEWKLEQRDGELSDADQALDKLHKKTKDYDKCRNCRKTFRGELVKGYGSNYIIKCRGCGCKHG